MNAANGREMTWPFLCLVHSLWAALGRGRKAAGAFPVVQPVQLPPTPIGLGERLINRLENASWTPPPSFFKTTPLTSLTATATPG